MTHPRFCLWGPECYYPAKVRSDWAAAISVASLKSHFFQCPSIVSIMYHCPAEEMSCEPQQHQLFFSQNGNCKALTESNCFRVLELVLRYLKPYICLWTDSPSIILSISGLHVVQNIPPKHCNSSHVSDFNKIKTTYMLKVMCTKQSI